MNILASSVKHAEVEQPSHGVPRRGELLLAGGSLQSQLRGPETPTQPLCPATSAK
jgi:hypothetical protein